MSKVDLIVILGCTATGKTKLAATLASQINGEIISADSRQVYRRMDVGTGKDLSEFTVEGVQVPYHLIDIVDAGEEYNVFEFQNDFVKAYQNILSRNNQVILCGGTGMYLEAVLKGYRLIPVPENKALRATLKGKTEEELNELLSSFKLMHNTTDSIDKNRIIKAIEISTYKRDNEDLINNFPKIKHQIFGVNFERDVIKNRITERLKTRFKNEGMIEEVEGLIKSGVATERLKFYGLEYKLITQFILGEIDRKEMFTKLNIAIHQFSKRQATWYRKMERNGFEINWIDGNLPLNEKVNLIIDNIGE
jgi:tRNA dimethylallyltransferase